MRVLFMEIIMRNNDILKFNVTDFQYSALFNNELGAISQLLGKFEVVKIKQGFF